MFIEGELFAKSRSYNSLVSRSLLQPWIARRACYSLANADCFLIEDGAVCGVERQQPPLAFPPRTLDCP